jgi:hypothetical protein
MNSDEARRVLARLRELVARRQALQHLVDASDRRIHGRQKRTSPGPHLKAAGDGR